MSASNSKKLSTSSNRDIEKASQLQLFELAPALKDYSNSIELYDTMPKYHIGGVKRKKDDKVESLPIISRDFVHRGKPHKLEISPAAILDKKTGKTIYYYPSQREELVEDVLRKIATQSGRTRFLEDKIGVVFTYYEVQQELIKKGHGYGIEEIKLTIDVMSKASLVVKDNNHVSITSNFFSTVGKEEKEMGGRERVLVMFHPLVSRAINSGNYRLFNYDKLMQMKMPLARWLHRRISHMFLQATINNPYEIKLSTIVHDSGMKSYKTISERMRQVDKAFQELVKAKVLSRVEAAQDKQKNKILDVLYSLYMSEEFVADAKKANKITNLRLTGEEENKITSEEIEEFKKEIQRPLYGLTQTVINNCVSNISNREDYDKVVTALEAVREYKEIEEKKGKKIGSLAALTKSAIREGWKPRNSEVIVEEKVKTEVQDVKNVTKEIEVQKDRKKLQEDPAWLKVKAKIRKEYDEKDWKKWLAEIEIYSINQTQIVLWVDSKFKRDWIIREFIESKREEKSIKSLVQEVWSGVTELKVISN
jgi:hypothetical protein